jgi:hypothetical protein
MSKKTFKTPKNSAFGASKREKVVPGDIVEWKSWEISLENEVFEVQKGLLTAILEEKRGENDVLIAQIMPFGGEKQVKIPLISVKKSEKWD